MNVKQAVSVKKLSGMQKNIIVAVFYVVKP